MKLFSQDGLPLTAAPDATRWALLIGINIRYKAHSGIRITGIN